MFNIKVIINATDQQFMNLNSSAFFILPRVKYLFLFSPLWSVGEPKSLRRTPQSRLSTMIATKMDQAISLPIGEYPKSKIVK